MRNARDATPRCRGIVGGGWRSCSYFKRNLTQEAGLHTILQAPPITLPAWSNPRCAEPLGEIRTRFIAESEEGVRLSRTPKRMDRRSAMAVALLTIPVELIVLLCWLRPSRPFQAQAKKTHQPARHHLARKETRDLALTHADSTDTPLRCTD